MDASTLPSSKSALQAAGFTTWRDTRNLDPHQDFTAEIEQGISDAEQVVVCLTPDIKRNDSFVRREIQYALVSKKRIIPLRFVDVVPPIYIINLTWIDFYKLGWDQAFIDLRQRLEASDDAYDVPASPPDPYREYLKALYDQIIAYLQQTVFALSSALIELRAEAQPDAVIQRQAFPLAFFGQAGIDAPQNEHQQFASFHEAFDYYGGRALLLGDPGAGKTTTLLAFVRDAVAKRLENSTLPLPITAPIATWRGEQLADWLARQIPLLNWDDLGRLVGEGKLLLALDGLDELGGEREGKDPRQQFLSLLPPNNHVVASCRVKDYGEIGQKAALGGAITLHSLDDAQMQSYLGNQLDLWAALQADDDLREVARTPLLLSLFAYAFNGLDNKEATKLQNLSRGDLRDRIFDTYIRRRYLHEARKRELRYSVDMMMEVLGVEALRNSGALTRVPSDNVLSKRWLEKKAEGMLEQGLLLHLLILIDDDHFRFIHLLLRDHFAVLAGLAALHDPNVQVRQRAAWGLVFTGSERAVEGLVAALHDPDVEVRRNVAEALGRIGSERAVEGLAVALHDSDEGVLWNAAGWLGKIGTPQAEAVFEAWRREQKKKRDAQ